MKSGKAQPSRKVSADPPVKVSTKPTQRTAPKVPPSHGNDGRGGGTGVTVGPADRGGSTHRYGNGGRSE